MSIGKSGKKNKKVFREGVVQLHGRFKIVAGVGPVLINDAGQSHGFKSVTQVGDLYRVTLNMPIATFLSTPVCNYIDGEGVAGGIVRPQVAATVSTPTYSNDPNVVQNPNHVLPSFDIVVWDYDGTVTVPNVGTVISFSATVTTSVVPNGTLPVIYDQLGPIPPTWNVAIAYVFGEKAELENKYYVALQASTAVEPGVTAGWEEYWKEYSLFPYENVARAYIGATTVVHTPKIESFTAYGRFRTAAPVWDNVSNYPEGATVLYDGKLWISLVGSNLNQPPGAGNGYWAEETFLITDDAKSEGFEKVELNMNSELYPGLPDNVYVVTMKPTSPIVQFLGAQVVTPIYKSGVASGNLLRDSKIWCEGKNDTFGTSANQFVIAFYTQDTIPEITRLEDSFIAEILLQVNYTTSKGF